MNFQPPVPFVVALLPSYQARVETTPLVLAPAPQGPREPRFFDFDVGAATSATLAVQRRVATDLHALRSDGM